MQQDCRHPDFNRNHPPCTLGRFAVYRLSSFRSHLSLVRFDVLEPQTTPGAGLSLAPVLRPWRSTGSIPEKGWIWSTEVQLAPGRAALRHRRPRCPVSKNSPSCRTFRKPDTASVSPSPSSTTRSTVRCCGAPISDVEIREQRYVQYFKTPAWVARTCGHRVVVTVWGASASIRSSATPNWLAYLPSYVSPSPPAPGAPSSPLYGRRRANRYVIVQDQFLRGI